MLLLKKHRFQPELETCSKTGVSNSMPHWQGKYTNYLNIYQHSNMSEARN